ncbi:hypothetical protein TUM4445_08200 [Shewanella sp. MBTL60-112-B2]|nr:hypothetical protein TUM4444_40940 [Shewanella sp. MBTL60-112-B1]GIU27719.1 hypothetical protein TUM4445_08200 [Shewanella sp. MBTL60-112-B2]
MALLDKKTNFESGSHFSFSLGKQAATYQSVRLLFLTNVIKCYVYSWLSFF